MALAILAAVGVVFALEWAQSFVISLPVGILFAYTLNPLVAWLERIRVPRVAGAAVVMLSVVCALAVGSRGAAGAIGQATMVLLLPYLLLLSGDTYKRKLVRLTGPTLSDKKITVQILDDINDSIQLINRSSTSGCRC